jgi:Zn-dependent protease with chaperone function
MTQNATARPMQARFYDGVHPVAWTVTVKVTPAELAAALDDGRVIVRWPVSEVDVVSDAEHEPHALLVCRQQPGTRLAVEDEALRQAIADLGGKLARAANKRPRIAPALGGVAAALAITVGAMAFAAEALPNVVAPFVPYVWQRSLGDSVVTAMTGDLRRCTGAEGQQALQTLIDRLQQASTYERKIDVVVVQNAIVNAFAVPGGRLVVFSGLIDKASGPEEVAGVLAHEVGHVVHHHSMKGLLRAYGFDMVMKLVTGGYSSDVATLGGAGGVLLALRHSREAEREADSTALELLDKVGMRADGLSTFFGKLLEMQNAPPADGKDKDKVKGKGPQDASGKPRDAAEDAGILSTHPPTRERLEATRRPPTGEAPLTTREWQQLRAICR